MVILVFAIGRLAVDQVAQCVVGVFDAVVFFKAVAAGKVGVGRGFQTTLSLGSSEIGAVVLPSPQPSPMGEGVDVGMSRMLWAGSKAKVSLRPVWLLRAS